MVTLKNPRYSLIFLLYIITFIYSASNTMVNSIVSLYAQDYIHASMLEIGFIISSFFIASALTKIVTGFFLHIHQIRIILIVGLCFIFISIFSYAFVNNFFSISFFRMLQGLGSVLFSVSALTFSSLVVNGNEQNGAISKYTLAIALGMMFGPLMSTFFIAVLGMRNTFLFISSLIFLSILLTLILIRKIHTLQINFSKMKLDYKNFFRVISNRIFVISFFSYFSLSFAFGIMLTYVPIYVKIKYDFIDEHITLLFFGYYLFLFIIRLGIGKCLKTFEKRELLIIGLLIAVCMLFLMSVSPSSIIFITAFSLDGLSMGIIFPIGAMMIADTINKKQLVLANSFYMLGWDLGCSISPILISFIVENFGVPHALVISSILPLTGVIIVSYARKKSEYEKI